MQKGIKFPAACNLRKLNYYRMSPRVLYLLRLMSLILSTFYQNLHCPLPQLKKALKEQ